MCCARGRRRWRRGLVLAVAVAGEGSGERGGRWWWLSVVVVVPVVVMLREVADCAAG